MGWAFKLILQLIVDDHIYILEFESTTSLKLISSSVFFFVVVAAVETVLSSFTVVVSCGLQDSLSSTIAVTVSFWVVGFIRNYTLVTTLIIYNIFPSFHASF